MKLIFCLLLGYLLGSLSPAAWISKRKKINLREHGTGNLGATNTMINLGRRYGILVMLFDICKAWAASKLAAAIFPDVMPAGLLAGAAAVLGHMYPFYLKLKGGKGLAAFGGMILAYDVRIFMILLVISLSAMLLVNYSCAMPISAAVLFPLFVYIYSRDTAAVAVSVVLGGWIIRSHRGNIVKAFRGEESRIRTYIRERLFR